jgi:hypothetical protein
MDNQIFDSWREWRPDEDPENIERGIVLAGKLWGITIERLQSQLLAPHPQIPGGYDIADFQRLASFPGHAFLHAFWPLTPNIAFMVGTRRFTVVEARQEIVRRAIESFETS